MKQMKRLTVLLLGMVLLTGCMKMRMEITVASDASVTAATTVLVSEEALEEGVTAEQVAEQIAQQYLADETFTGTVTPVTEKDGDVNFYGAKITGIETNFTAKEEENQIVIEIPIADAEQEVIGESGAFDDANEDDMKEMIDSGLEMKLIINMPSKPTTNVGTVKGNTVTVDLLDLPAGEDTIVVSCQKGGNSSMIWIVGGVVVVGAVVAYLLTRKKKEPVPTE